MPRNRINNILYWFDTSKTEKKKVFESMLQQKKAKA